MLEVRDITKIYNPGAVTERRLFQHFSLTVDEGQFVAIVGSNGSGKISLLNIICGSIHIESGDVLVALDDTEILSVNMIEGFLEGRLPEETVTAHVERVGRDGYTAMEYQVTLGGR